MEGEATSCSADGERGERETKKSDGGSATEPSVKYDNVKKKAQCLCETPLHDIQNEILIKSRS